MHPAAWNTAQLLQQCQFRRQRRSGPGGQHRNKVETAVVITHRPTAIRGEASERRSQAANRRQAIFRLRVNLALAVRAEPSREKRPPSDTWRRHCQSTQLTIRATHEDFPAMLAEALDALQDHDFRLPAAAAFLACTPSQLTRFLQLEPRALALVNQQRRSRGARPLR